MRLLLCEDSALYRWALRDALAGRPDIEIAGEAENGAEAVALAETLRPDVVLMDVGLPVMDGIEATRRILARLPDVAVLALTANGDAETVVPMLEAGARGFWLKGGGFDDLHAALERVRTGLVLDDRLLGSVFDEAVSLYHREQEKARRLDSATTALQLRSLELDALTRGVVMSLLGAIELRDGYTAGHARRVVNSANLLTARVSPDLAESPLVEFGYLLHDIGKLGVPDSILQKAFPLTGDELWVLRSHVEIGLRLLDPLPPLFEPALEVVRCHHERWDGGGYPNALEGTEIPLAARIFSVCDTFDAMTSHRPYRRAVSTDDARAELERCVGTQFDPEIVPEFVDLIAAVDLAEAAA